MMIVIAACLPDYAVSSSPAWPGLPPQHSPPPLTPPPPSPPSSPPSPPPPCPPAPSLDKPSPHIREALQEDPQLARGQTSQYLTCQHWTRGWRLTAPEDEHHRPPAQPPDHWRPLETTQPFLIDPPARGGTHRTLDYCIRIKTTGGIYGKIWPEPEGNSEGNPEGSGLILP